MSIKFQILDLYGKDSETYEFNKKTQRDERSNKYKIYIFGKTLEDQSVCLEVNGFTPYFYVKMPEGFKKDDKPKFEKWVRENPFLNYYAKKSAKDDSRSFKSIPTQ